MRTSLFWVGDGTILVGQTLVGQPLCVKYPYSFFGILCSLRPQDELEADPVIQGRPVVLQSKDCHAIWVSKKVLEASLPFPETIEGGVIVRDASGRPTGEDFYVVDHG